MNCYKRLLCIGISFCMCHSLFSQIDKEILNFTDTTEIKVLKGRKYLVNVLENKDFQKAGDIFEYLEELTSNHYYKAFNRKESLYLSLLTENWYMFRDKILSDIPYNNLMYNQMFMNITPMQPNLYPLEYYFKEKLINNISGVRYSLAKADIAEEDKDFIYLYLYDLESGSTSQEYTLMYNKFTEQYPNSLYNPYIIRGAPRKNNTNITWSFAFGPYWAFPKSKLKDLIGDYIPGYLSMDIVFDRIYTSLFVEFGAKDIQQNFRAYSNGDTVNYYIGESFETVNGGLKAGYLLLNNKHIRLGPILSFSGVSMRSNRYKEPDNHDLELEIYDTFAYSYGGVMEIKLKQFTPMSSISGSYYNQNLPSYLSLKFEVGYNYIQKFKVKQFEGDYMYSGISLTWGLGEF